MKKSIGLLLIILLVLMAVPAGAESDVQTGNVDTYDVEPMAFQYILRASSTISYLGNGSIYIDSETTTLRRVDLVRTTVVLQRLNNGTWTNVQTYTNPQYNAFTSVVHGSIPVPKGYYYRIRGFHYVSNQGFVESVTTTTQSIYAN